MADENKGILDDMLDFFELSSSAENDNREKGLKAVRFKLGGKDQWDEGVYTFRTGDGQSTESFNQIPQFVHQVTNDMRMNMPQVRFIPGNDGSKEVAEVYEDLARNIQSSSEAEVAFDTAADFQVTMGWGYFRVLTDYEDDKTFNQIIKIGRISNPFTVYDDPFAEMQDKSDRTRLLQVSDEKLKDFNKDYPDLGYGESTLQSIGDDYPNWSSQADKTLRVAEFWRVENKTTKLYRKKDSDEVSEEKPEGYNEDDYESRDVIKPKIMWYKCTANHVLDSKEWPGKYIPYVFVAGEETNIEGQRIYSGIVEGLIPGQRLFNYGANSVMEMVALAPRAQFVLDPIQIEGYTDYWDKANIKNYPYLPARIYDDDGRQYPAPQRAQNSADISSSVNVMNMGQDIMYKGSGISQSGLGYKSNESSGVAIQKRQTEGDVSTFHYPDNMARALRFLGRVLADLFPIIYDTPRALRLLKEDKSNYEVKVNQPYTDPETKERKYFDLKTGTYDVAVTTGPSYTTKRQEAADSWIKLAQTYPDLMTIAGGDIIRNLDLPGADAIAEAADTLAPPQVQALKQNKGKNQIPPQVQAQMMQMQQMVEQLTQQVQQQQQELESKQADIQLKAADLQQKQQDMMAGAQSDQLKAETDKLKIQLEAEKLEFEKMKLASEMEMGQAKMQLDGMKMRLDAKAAASPDALMTDPELQEDGVSPISAMMGNMVDILNQGLAQVAQITAQSSEAIVQSNMMVAKTNEDVASAIRAPKDFNIRRDELGRLEAAQVTAQ